MYIILISIFICIFFRILFLKSAESTDDWVHMYMVRSRRYYKNPFDYKALDSILVGNKGYPQLYHYIVSLFPENNYALIGRLLNIFFDCLVISFSVIVAKYFFNSTKVNPNEFNALYVGIIIASSPILLPTTARIKAMGARVMGFMLYIFFLSFSFLLLHTNEILELTLSSLGIIIFLHLIVLTSQFALQVSIWTIVILFFVYMNFLFIFVTLFSLFLILKFNYFGTKDVASQIISNWRWYFKVAKLSKAPMNRSKWKDHLYLFSWIFNDPYKALIHCTKKSTLIVSFYSVLPFFILIYFVIFDKNLFVNLMSHPLSKFLFCISISLAVACFITSLKFFQFLGQAERYFEYAFPAIAILYVYVILISNRGQEWILYIIIFQIFGVLINFVYLNLHIFSKKKTSKVELNFTEVLDFLRKQKPSKIVTLPTKMSYRISTLIPSLHKYYFQHIDMPKNGLSYMIEDHEDYNFIKTEYSFFKKKYNIDKIVISKKYLNAALEKNIRYKISLYNTIFENDDYLILSI